MQIPKSPRDIGLPHGTWYPQQQQALQWFADSKAKVLFLDAPTASGKTALLAGMQAMLDRPIYAAMWSKRLQEQGHEMLNAPIIMGRQNFSCLEEEGETCEFAWCDGDAALKNACPFQRQLKEGQKAPLTILNYGVLFQYMGNGLEKRNLLVCDEGHTLEDAMGNWLDVGVHRFWLSDIEFPIPLPDWVDKQTLYEWSERAAAAAVPSYLDKRVAARWKKARYLAGKMHALLKRSDEVIVVYRDFLAQVRVIWPLRRFREVMEHFDKIVVMSATLGDMDALARDMNLEPVDYETLALPSIIPVERRKIFYRPIENLNNDATALDYQAMACGIIDIVRTNFPNERGLIHVSSYRMAQRLGKALIDADPAIGRRIIREYKRDPSYRRQWETRLDAPILVTPAAGLGVDLPYLFPYQIIAKCPYPDLGDPLVGMRARSDPRWYVRSTARKLVQIAGRVTRTPTDDGITVITDSTFGNNVYERAPDSFPKWFKEALR